MSEVVGTAKLVYDELHRRGIEVDTYQQSNLSHHIFTYGDKTRQVTGVNPDLSSGTSSVLGDNKTLTYRLLSTDAELDMRLVPTASTETVDEFLAEHGTIVVKPSDADHGDGITVGITDLDQARSALDVAQQCSPRNQVEIQKHVSGDDYRVLVIDGEAIAAVRRKPAHVIGDGSRTVEQLVESENDTNPMRGAHAYTSPMNKIDMDAVKRYLSQAELERVPAVSEEVQVVGVSNIGAGGSAQECYDDMPNEILQAAERAAQLSGIFTCGFDVIASPDFTQWWIMEVNASPSFLLHTMPAIGDSVDVTKIFVDKLLTAYDAASLPTIGVTARVDFDHTAIDEHVPARVDSGARTSSMWASDINKTSDDTVSFCLFSPSHPDYTGEVIEREIVDVRTVKSSMGAREERYVITMGVTINGTAIHTEFTLADRSRQLYPILLGRNTLAGHFLVDCSQAGDALHEEDPDNFEGDDE